MYIEDRYTERYGCSVDVEEVLKKVYQLIELVHGKKVEEPLVKYEDELMLQMNEKKHGSKSRGFLDKYVWWLCDQIF